MSSASHAHPGSPTVGATLVKILIIAAIWAALVLGTMHYVGNVWPKTIQINQAVEDAANEKAKEALNPPKPEAPAAAAASGSAAPLAKASTPSAPATTPAASTTTTATAAPAAGSAAAKASGSTATATATAAPAAGSSTPAASAPKATGEAKLPKDPSLAGYDRSAMWNVAVFYSIVISVFAVGAIIMQVYKHCHVEEEEAAH